MKRLFLLGCMALGLNAMAQTPTQDIDLSTGVWDNTTNQMAVGTDDDTWKVIDEHDISEELTPRCVTQIPQWTGASCGRWITPYYTGSSSSTMPSSGANIGNYTYIMRFTPISPVCWGAGSAKILFTNIGGDNTIVNVKVNDVTLTGLPQNISYTTSTFKQNVELNVPGSVFNMNTQNTLSITVYNTDTYTALFLCGKLTIDYSPNITASGSIICASVTSVTLTSTNSASSRQWQKRECNGSFTDIPSATGMNYVVTNGNSDGTLYRLRTTCNTASYGSVTMYSNELLVKKLTGSCASPLNNCFVSTPNNPGQGGGGYGSRMGIVSGGEKAPAVASIYPNPFSQDLFVKWTGEDEVHVTIIDALGKVILTQSGAANTEIKLELTNSPHGIYFAKITAGGETIMKKIIKEN